MANSKQIQFFLASTGEVIETIPLAVGEAPSADQIEAMRQQLAFDRGFELNSIGVKEIDN